MKEGQEEGEGGVTWQQTHVGLLLNLFPLHVWRLVERFVKRPGVQCDDCNDRRKEGRTTHVYIFKAVSNGHVSGHQGYLGQNPGILRGDVKPLLPFSPTKLFCDVLITNETKREQK